MHLGLSGFEGTKTIPKTVGSMQTMLFAFLLVTTFIFVECGVCYVTITKEGYGKMLLALYSSSNCNGYNLQETVMHSPFALRSSLLCLYWCMAGSEEQELRAGFSFGRLSTIQRF